LNLKTQNGWDSGGNGTDASGFSILPGGFRDLYGEFFGLGSYTYFWTSVEKTSTKAYFRYLKHDSDGVERNATYKGNSFSCRCLRD